MAFSTQRAVSNGTLVLLGVSIGYIKQADIAVLFNGLPAPAGTWAWVGNTTNIAFTPAVPNGVEVLLKRTTQIDKVINRFTAGAGFTNQSMDTDFTQMLYLNQEAVEGAALTDIFNDVDFHGKRPTNIGPAVNPNDAVSLSQYQADALGAFQFKETAVAAAAAALVSQNAAAVDAASALASKNAAAASATASANSAAAALASKNSSDANVTSSAASAAAALVSANNAAASAAAATTEQNSSNKWLTSLLGTNTLTATLNPDLTSYVAGQVFNLLVSVSNTGAVTINIDALGAKAITKQGGVPLSTGDLVAGRTYSITYDGTQFQLGGGAGSSAEAGGVFYLSKNYINQAYTIPAGSTAISGDVELGPLADITVNGDWSIV